MTVPQRSPIHLIHDLLQRHKPRVIVAFLVLWAVGAAFRLLELRTPPAPDLRVTRSADGGAPSLLMFFDSTDAVGSPLRVGDRLVQVGDRPLAGVGQFGFLVAWHGAWWGRGDSLPIVVERDGTRMTVQESRRSPNMGRYVQTFTLSLLNVLVALLVLARGRPSLGSSALVSGMAAYGLMFMTRSMVPGWYFPVQFSIAVVTACCAAPGLLLLALGFPDEAGRLRGPHLWWPWAFAGVSLVWVSMVYGLPIRSDVAGQLGQPLSGLWVVLQPIIYTLNFRASSAAGRRRVKWVIAGAYAGVLLTLLVILGTGEIAQSEDSPPWATLTMGVAGGLFPLSLLVAMLRADLFDVDRLLGATVSYNLLAVLVLGAGFAVVPALSAGIGAQLGLDPAIGRTVITVTLAALALGAERRVRPYVDRFFFRERFALERAMAELPEHFAGVRRADELWTLMTGTLDETLRPASSALFLSAGDTFVPMQSADGGIASALPARTPLVAWIDGLPGATLVRPGMPGPGAEGRQLLESLGARVVIPIHRGRALEAILLLGEKRSGDIFTSTDVTLLTSIAKSASSHLLRFDEQELVARAKEMQDKMRRYVPGAIAEAIALGDDLETGEREVSVLFVDIRGYTAYAHGRDTTDIFSTVNRYTETVSAIVNRCGGVVVEFNGDGMMAVFGAPRPLPAKEAAAVRAARELVSAVPRMAPAGSDTTLGVGVGVATGLAFVGNIEAVDRTIWSAIGSTTNLAARLQNLTREHGASVLVCETTWQRAAQEAAGFTRLADIAIRGRRGTDTLYALPLTPAGGTSPATA